MADDPSSKVQQSSVKSSIKPARAPALPAPVQEAFDTLGANPTSELAYVFRIAASFLAEKQSSPGLLTSTTLFFALTEYARQEPLADQAAYELSQRLSEKYHTEYEELRQGYFRTSKSHLIDRREVSPR